MEPTWEKMTPTYRLSSVKAHTSTKPRNQKKAPGLALCRGCRSFWPRAAMACAHVKVRLPVRVHAAAKLPMISTEPTTHSSQSRRRRGTKAKLVL